MTGYRAFPDAVQRVKNNTLPTNGVPVLYNIFRNLYRTGVILFNVIPASLAVTGSKVPIAAKVMMYITLGSE